MNDTPRTDAEVFLLFKTGDDEGVPAEFARKLERENARLRNEVVRLNNQTMWVCSCGGTDCAGQKENAALRDKLAVLERDYAALDDRYERLVEKEAQP